VPADAALVRLTGAGPTVQVVGDGPLCYDDDPTCAAKPRWILTSGSTPCGAPLLFGLLRPRTAAAEASHRHFMSALLAEARRVSVSGAGKRAGPGNPAAHRNDTRVLPPTLRQQIVVQLHIGQFGCGAQRTVTREPLRSAKSVRLRFSTRRAVYGVAHYRAQTTHQRRTLRITASLARVGGPPSVGHASGVSRQQFTFRIRVEDGQGRASAAHHRLSGRVFLTVGNAATGWLHRVHGSSGNSRHVTCAHLPGAGTTGPMDIFVEPSISSVFARAAFFGGVGDPPLPADVCSQTRPKPGPRDK